MARLRSSSGDKITPVRAAIHGTILDTEMSGQIFISYRRDDSSAWAGRLSDHLSNHFPSNQIFMDVDSVDLGEDFARAIEKTVQSCDVLIAVIGKGWLTSRDQEGQPRLDNPDDFVRIEIATALERDVRVIPVLVDGASVPRPGDLPDDLKALASRNALQLSHDRFRADSERLASAVERALEKTAAERREREEKERLAVQRQREKKERRPEPKATQPDLRPTVQGLSTSLVGEVIGNYKLEALVGAGGFGEVYRAKHIHLGNEVAIKLSYSLQSLTPELMRVFFRRVRGLAALNHPCIAKVHDFGQIDLLGERRVFLTTDLIDGISLADAISSHRAADWIPRGIRLFWQICEGIAAAHATKYVDEVGFEIIGVLHGDIKPANILIDRAGNAKIIDFMMADFQRLLDPRVIPPALLDDCSTRVFGTPGYMAPEQEIEGVVTRETDIYALGEILYEICFGQRFSKAGASKVPIIHRPLEGLSRASSCMPGWVVPLITKCTAEDPAERFKNVSELIAFAQQRDSFLSRLQRRFGPK